MVAELDTGLYQAVRSTLPVSVASVETDGCFNARIVGLSGVCEWLLSIDCDFLFMPSGYAGEFVRNTYDSLLQVLTGRLIVDVCADGSAFDPVFVLDDGARLQLLCEDENAPWYLSCGEVEVEWLSWNDHELWLQGGLSFDS
ncbi:hypothetical protein [Rothia sp. CCM 9416]|uniref:hypothetical protein n=1 Tax=Rothia sp. CCM 9416 TaxID=3402655 RepID=UPI003ADD70E2